MSVFPPRLIKMIPVSVSFLGVTIKKCLKRGNVLFSRQVIAAQMKNVVFDQENHVLTWRSRGDFGILSFVPRMNFAYDISFGATFVLL